MTAPAPPPPREPIGEEFVVCPHCARRDPFLGDRKSLYQSGAVGIDRDGYFVIEFWAKCGDCGFSYKFNNAWYAGGSQ
jgi:hypothetical protein